MCDEEEIEKRMLKGTQLFGMLRQNLMASKDTWPEVKTYNTEKANFRGNDNTNAAGWGGALGYYGCKEKRDKRGVQLDGKELT
jgi:hypothetical protein